MTNEYQERYHRQGLIKGWDQKKLTDSRVVIIGGGYLTEFISLGLAALGVGELRIFTNERNGKVNGTGILDKFKKYTDYSGNEKVKVFSSVLKRINKTINIIGVHSVLNNRNIFHLFNNPDLIVDATNNLHSKILCQEYSKSNKIPFISISSNDGSGMVDVNPNEDVLSGYKIFENSLQNLIVSEVLSGFAIDEVRKILLPLNKDDKVSTKTLKYNLMGSNRFGG